MRRLLLILTLFLLLPRTVRSAVVFDGQSNSQRIGEALWLLEDPQGKVDISNIHSQNIQAGFRKSENAVLTFQNDFDYWIRLDLDNRTNEPILLEFAQPIIEHMEFYYYDSAQSRWRKEEAGYTIPLSKKLYQHQFHVFRLKNNKGTYYIKFKSRAISIPVKLWKENVYGNKLAVQRISFGAFIGLMAFVILINIFFFFSLKRSEHLHYALLVFLYFLIGCNVEGYILYAFPNADLYYGISICAIMAFPVGMSYVLNFLEAKKYTPRLYRMGIIIFIYYCTLIIWHRFLTPLQLHYTTDVTGLSIVLIFSYISITAGRKGNKMGYYYFICYMIFFVIAVIDSINRFTGKPALIMDLTYISYAFLAEAFMFSFLLTMRFDLEKKTSDQKKREAEKMLLEKTLENEKLVREQNVVLEKKVAERTTELMLEKKKSDDLLLNILPAEVASELKAHGKYRARKFENVTVLFTDVKNFTQLTAASTPEDIISLLDIYFREFDRIIKKYNLEKIKTIGDAYMCAGGVPVVSETHAVDVVNAGLEIRDFADAFIRERKAAGLSYFEIRMGISSGSVMAGIIGTDKFVYDIWGDCVNTAARMEQNSEVGSVNISESTYQLVKDHFDIEPRGKIQAKNKGMIEMYFVKSIKNSPPENQH